MSSELQRCGFVVQWPIKKQQNQLTIGTLRFLVNKKTYWCLAGNEGMIHFITINNHPSNPHSNPSIPYVKRTSKKKTRGFLFGLLNQLPHQTWEMLLQLSRMGWYHGLRTQPNYGRISSSRHLTIEHVVNTIKKITLLNSKCGQYQQCVPKEINAYIGDIESLYYPKRGSKIASNKWC